MVCGQEVLYGLQRGGRTFDELVLQVQHYGSSVSNIFEGSFTEEGTGAVNSVFGGVFKFEASEARNNSDSISLAVQIDEDRSGYPSTQEYQKLEGKLNHDSTGE